MPHLALKINVFFSRVSACKIEGARLIHDWSVRCEVSGPNDFSFVAQPFLVSWLPSADIIWIREQEPNAGC